jgi:hypothetical protein
VRWGVGYAPGPGPLVARAPCIDYDAVWSSECLLPACLRRGRGMSDCPCGCRSNFTGRQYYGMHAVCSPWGLMRGAAAAAPALAHRLAVHCECPVPCWQRVPGRTIFRFSQISRSPIDIARRFRLMTRYRRLRRVWMHGCTRGVRTPRLGAGCPLASLGFGGSLPCASKATSGPPLGRSCCGHAALPAPGGVWRGAARPGLPGAAPDAAWAGEGSGQLVLWANVLPRVRVAGCML